MISVDFGGRAAWAIAARLDKLQGRSCPPRFQGNMRQDKTRLGRATIDITVFPALKANLGPQTIHGSDFDLRRSAPITAPTIDHAQPWRSWNRESRGSRSQT